MAADNNKTANTTNILFLILVVNIINTNLAQSFLIMKRIGFNLEQILELNYWLFGI